MQGFASRLDRKILQDRGGPAPYLRSMTHQQIIQDIYDRFARGDAPGVLAHFDSRIEFRLAEGHPYQRSGEPWVGKEAVVESFFVKAGREWEDWRVEARSFLEAAGAVIVEGRYRGTYKPTGRPLDLQVCHVFRFDGDRVKSFHQYVDTARLQAVMNP
jgi:ketosteroid isomerase-like protein